jgi:type II secretory pathway pseudopilin PulG
MTITRSHRLILSSAPTREGTTIVEGLTAIAVLSALAVCLFPFLTRLSEARQSLEERKLALRELRNLAEEALAQPRGAEMELSPLLRERLRSPRLEVTRENEIGTPPGERLTLSLTWQTTSGRRTAPLQLTCWRFGEEEAP